MWKTPVGDEVVPSARVYLSRGSFLGGSGPSGILYSVTLPVLGSSRPMNGLRLMVK